MQKTPDTIDSMVKALEGPTSALQELLEAAAQKEPEHEDLTKNMFACGYFASFKDKNGVSYVDPSYAKRSCKACYGRGCFVETKADGKRYFKLCRCVENGYQRRVKAANERPAYLVSRFA